MSKHSNDKLTMSVNSLIKMMAYVQPDNRPQIEPIVSGEVLTSVLQEGNKKQ